MSAEVSRDPRGNKARDWRNRGKNGRRRVNRKRERLIYGERRTK